MSRWQQSASAGSTRWLARECSELIERLASPSRPRGMDGHDFDLLIIGSGYGAAVAAVSLAGCTNAEGQPLRIGVLERGREYLPGSFPSRMAEMPTTLRGRFAGQARGGEGLFDLRASATLNVLVANGLGGGSLINAGVMEIPKPTVFDARWPKSWRSPAMREPYYRQARQMLGATAAADQPATDNQIGLQAGALPAKTEVLRQMARGDAKAVFRPAAITIAMADKTTIGNVRLKACNRCGDCATGCNFSAKESLDTNLLALAHQKGGEIYCGATVLKLARPEPRAVLTTGWRVQLTHTDEKLRAREGGPVWLTARRVIVAAGTLGSTEILLRSQRSSQQPKQSPLMFSSRLGQGFSANGDMISFGYAHGPQANAFADEDQPSSERGVGPTITGIIDTTVQVKGGADQHIVLQELAVPGPIRRVIEELVTTADTLHALGERDRSDHQLGHPDQDPYAVQPGKIARTSVLAAMGDDGAAGVLKLEESEDDGKAQGDGHIALHWPELNQLPLFDAQNQKLASLAGALGESGRSIANPLWKLLPPAMEPLISNARGPLMSVHPLGGCAMGADALSGVVDEFGRVFDAALPKALHEGLLVLDGAIVPSALSTNPALTIAALALRAVEKNRQSWGWVAAPARITQAVPRPVLVDVEADIRTRKAEPVPVVTQARFSERLTGPVRLRNREGAAEDCVAELTLTYDALPLKNLFTPNARGQVDAAVLTVSDSGQDNTPSGVLSIYRRADWEADRDLWPNDPQHAAATSPARSYAVDGRLTVLRREPVGQHTRLLRGLAAWLPARGLRDLVQALQTQRQRQREGYIDESLGLGRRFMDALKLASHAGEVRLFEYDLRLTREIESSHVGPRFTPAAVMVGAAVCGEKRITYTGLGNPWRQLQELPIRHMPGLMPCAVPPVLKLDPAYFAARGAPLWQISAQRDHTEALADAASLMAYFARMLLSIHLWSFRKPDTAVPRTIRRLPGEIPGLPAPEQHTLEVDRLNGQPVQVLLTRYRNQPVCQGAASVGPPVVMIHGYSASGTTFAHPSLKPGLARYFADAGRDVWVLDLRSSCGLPTARHAWTFEQMALMDIPAAIDHICFKTGAAQVDVVAHCMGAAMLSMAVLSADQPIDQVLSGRDRFEVIDRFAAQRRELPGRLRRVVLSQVGPLVVLSPDTIFRAYLLSFVEQVIGVIPYDFRAGEHEGLGGELFDRLLASLPYPDDELQRENPLWPWAKTPYVGSRHRMDALYGRTFKLGNMSDAVLAHIDDFFGPLNIDTVSQVMHFAALRTITNRAGRNRFVSSESLRKHWRFPTLSLHGDENGLADAATGLKMQRVLHSAGCDYRMLRLPQRGHQDSLIGERVADGFAHMLDFLAADTADSPRPVASQAPHYQFLAAAPFMGPVLMPQPQTGTLWLSCGAAPELGQAMALCLLPVQPTAEGWQADRTRLSGWALGPDEKADWVARALPAWATAKDTPYLLVLMIYPQSGCMALGDVPFLGGLVTESVEPQWLDIAPRSGLPLPPAVLAQLAALSLALDAVEARMAQQPRTPPGVLVLPAAEAERMPVHLALGSCQYAPDILDTPVAYRAWAALADQLEAGALSVDALVLTGDQVYTDATAGVFDPTQPDDRYRKPYEKWLSNPAVKDLLRRAPVVTTPDDHELIDNWQPQLLGTGQNELYRRRGLSAFRFYQRAPVAAVPADTEPPPIWFQLSRHGVPLFLLDTRSEREHRAASVQAPRRLFAEAQAEALLSWLSDSPADRPKLIVAPAVLLPRHRCAVPARLAFGQGDAGDTATLRSDGWDGYPDSLFPLLHHIATQQIQGVVLLSGDEHLGLFTEITLTAAGLPPVVVHSIHSPGLYAPYRFANARPDDFLLDEYFEFSQAADVTHCAVNTEVFRDPGFVQVSLLPTGTAGWRLRCRGAAGQGGLIVDKPLF